MDFHDSEPGAFAEASAPLTKQRANATHKLVLKLARLDSNPQLMMKDPARGSPSLNLMMYADSKQQLMSDAREAR